MGDPVGDRLNRTERSAAIDYLRKLVAAYTSGDADELERLIEAAGDWLATLEGEPEVKTEEPAAAGGSGQPAPAKGISPIVPIGSADALLVALYNAAKRVVDQGPNASTLAELEAAVKNAERAVVR